MNVNGVTQANPSVIYKQYVENKDVDTEDGDKIDIIDEENSDQAIKDVDELLTYMFNQQDNRSSNLKEPKDSISYEERLKQVISLEEIKQLLLIATVDHKKSKIEQPVLAGQLVDVKR